MKAPTTAPGRPGASLGARTAWALLAGASLFALLVGVPLLLAAMTGWPPALPAGAELDYPRLHAATIARKTLGLAGWVAWAWLIMALVRDLIHAWRWGLRPETVRDAASPARWIALTLIGAIAALWPGAANAAPASVPEPVTTGVAVDDPVAAPPTSPVAAQQLAWRASDTTLPPGSARHVDTDTDQAEDLGQGTSVRVEKGDTLSSLAAAHYGDEHQWPRIWEANRDRVFDDGQRFTDPDQIHPGWELRLPEAATDNAPSEPEAAATPPAGSVFHTVTAEDTLSGLAARYLGDADRYMELFNANQGRTFADGRQLSDPDLIVDGWTLVIPTAEATEDPNDGSTSPEHEAPPETDTTAPGTVPGPGDDGVIAPGHDPAPSPPEDPTGEADPGRPGPEVDETGKAVDTPEAEAPEALPPLGVWLGAGTCLAAGTVVSIALRARRRRPAAPAPAAEEPLTGRLNDLEAIIEAENHKLLDATTEPTAPVAVDQTRDPVDLYALAADGVGLLGPGQHGAARAAIVAAAAGEAHVHITAAADLRLDLADAARPASVRIGDQLINVLAQTENREGDIAIVCTDTDLDETTRPLLDRFLARDGHGAIILGDWEPATVRLDGTGNVLDARGQAADLDLDLLHIAEAATAAALLAELCEPAAAPPTTAAPSPAAHEPTDLPPTAPSAKTAPGRPEDGPERPDTDTADAPKPVTRLRLCLFGPPDVYLGETPIALKKGKRARALLAVLALADGPIPRTELLDAVVGDQDPASARNNLNTIGSTTRRNLQDATGTDAPFYRYDDATGYQLDTARFSTDVADFDAAEQAAALSTDPAEATAHLSRLTALYTGDLAEGIDTPTIRALREQYRAAAARASRKLADLIETHDPARAHHHRQRAATLESASPALHQTPGTGQPATAAPAPAAGARRAASNQAPRPAPHQPNR